MRAGNGSKNAGQSCLSDQLGQKRTDFTRPLCCSTRVNDGILRHWFAGVAGPFVVFVAVAVAGRALGAIGLAAILATKAVADLWFQERAFRRTDRTPRSA